MKTNSSKDYTLHAILLPFMIVILYYILSSCTNDIKHKRISFPEEIQLVKAGDKLVVDIVTDKEIILAYDNHYCDWEDCPHQGENMDQHNFISKWKGGYDELTDGWCVEITHFMNPNWTYEQCEDYVFAGIE